MSRAPTRVTLRRRIGIVLGIVVFAVGPGACTDGPPSEVPTTIERDLFIDAYVDLRDVALRKPSRVLNAAERDSLLAMHELTEDDLRTFLEVHHVEAEYMRDLWNEVEARISLMLNMSQEPEAD